MNFAKAKSVPALSGNPSVKESVTRRSSVANTVKTALGRGGEVAPKLRRVAEYGVSYSYLMPVPPSLNSIYKNVSFRTKAGRKTSRRSKTQEYEDWCLEADWELARQNPVRFSGRVDVSIVVAEQKNSDIDNRIKPILDSLKRCGVIVNDSCKYVRSVSARWSHEEQGCRVNVYHAPAGTTVPA